MKRTPEPYQSLLKIFLAERLATERRFAHAPQGRKAEAAQQS